MQVFPLATSSSTSFGSIPRHRGDFWGKENAKRRGASSLLTLARTNCSEMPSAKHQSSIHPSNSLLLLDGEPDDQHDEEEEKRSWETNRTEIFR